MAELQQMVNAKDVARIASQAEETFKNDGCHWDTYFYNVVLAGNVEVIKQVISYMENNESSQTLDWLFQRHDFEDVRHIKKKSSNRLVIIRVLMFIILTLVNILLTPVFYAVHILATSYLNRKRKRISGNIQLPLAYAAFRQKKEMVLFFLSQKVDMDHVDHYGNNVFHYVSDLSAVASSKAIQIFQNIVKGINDMDYVKRLLEQERNSAGLTAVEYAAKFGSPSLLSQILKQPNLMHTTPFTARADCVAFSDGDDQAEGEVIDHDCSTRVELVNVSMYEAGSLADQSSLLNILSDRIVVNISQTELQIYSDAEIMGKWLILKCKQMLPGVLFFHMCNCIFTCILVYLLNTTRIGQHGVAFGNSVMRTLHQVQMDELTAWSNNTSTLFQPQAFHRIENDIILRLQQYAIESMWESDEDKVRNLLNAASLGHILPEENNPDGTKMQSTIFPVLNHTHMRTLYQHVQNMSELAGLAKQLQVIQLYPKIRKQLAEELVALQAKSKFLSKFDPLDFSHYDAIDELYNNMTVEDGIIRPSSAVSVHDILDEICVPWTLGQIEEDDLIDRGSVLTFSYIWKHVAGNACYYRIFLIASGENRACQKTDEDALLTKMFPSSDRSTSSRLLSFVLWCTCIYIVINMFERCIFFTKCVVYQTNLRDMVLMALSQKVPGSYVRKQLNILACLAILFWFCINQYAMSKNDKSSNNEIFYEYADTATMVFVIAIVLRFLMHVHSLRLLPGIGHFVITTFVMGTNLLHFSAVFGIVLLIFSALFHILIDDPKCPLEKMTEFVTLQESIFATFKLTFTHGEMEPFFSSAPVKLTYVLFAITVGLLLLNLIIAIMTTTAMRAMAEPWREVLWKVEWLDEATSVEYTFNIITLPFRKFHGLKYYSHKKAGFIVKKVAKNKCNIYIEFFHCPALEEE